jgi:hypothetical protein
MVGGQKKIVICKTRKSVRCTKSDPDVNEDSSNDLGEKTDLETSEITEECKQEKESTCAAALPFDMKHWVQDAQGIIEQALLVSNTTGVQLAPGCASLGSMETVLDVCASTLLMF